MWGQNEVPSIVIKKYLIKLQLRDGMSTRFFDLLRGQGGGEDQAQFLFGIFRLVNFAKTPVSKLHDSISIFFY